MSDFLENSDSNEKMNLPFLSSKYMSLWKLRLVGEVKQKNLTDGRPKINATVTFDYPTKDMGEDDARRKYLSAIRFSNYYPPLDKIWDINLKIYRKPPENNWQCDATLILLTPEEIKLEVESWWRGFYRMNGGI